MALILACALLVKLLIPTGWMPVVGTEGVRLTLCGLAAPNAAAAAAVKEAAERLAGHDGHGDDAPTAPAADQPCTYAGLAFAGIAPGPAAPLPVRAVAPKVRPVAAPVSIGRGLAAPPPPATGPPLHA